MVGKGTLALKRPITRKPDVVTPRADPTPLTEADGRFTNRCYVLIGPSGSGKSHWVDTLLRRWKGVYPALICEDDHILQECKRTGESFTEVQARIDAAEQKRITDGLFNAALGVRRDIIIDRPNLTEDDRCDLLLRLPDHYQKVGIVFTCPTNLLYDRLEARFQETGRPYSRQVIGNSLRRFERPGRFEFHRVTNIDHLCNYN